jgi:hypothetical protein
MSEKAAFNNPQGEHTEDGATAWLDGWGESIRR